MTIADIRRILQDADSALGGCSNAERLNECAAALINAIRDIDTNLPELGAERPAAIAKYSSTKIPYQFSQSNRHQDIGDS